jgi:hypothetical protein
MKQDTIRLNAGSSVSISSTTSQLKSLEALLPWIPTGLFLLSFIFLLRTLSPTVYELDSAELATGAAVLGIAHAPGYPLYLMIAHGFTWLPFGDVAFRVNLFSAICLALTTPVLYSFLHRLTRTPLVSAAAAMTFTWSYYVWSSANKAEVYSPQIFTLALCAWGLVWMYQEFQTEGRVSPRRSLITGLLFGIAVAMAPSSVFFAPGLVVAFLLMRVPLRVSFSSGVLAVGIVLAVLLYFPLRGSALPEFNKIGFYDSQGIFHNYDYHSPSGIMKAVSGEQFRHLFFMRGYIPTLDQLQITFSWFWRNYLGIGVLLGLLGGIYLLRQRRGLLITWLALALPYTYFYLCYGAIDRDTMFGPTYLAWAVLLAFGLRSLGQRLPNLLRYSIFAALPLLALFSNFSSVDLSRDTSVRDHAQAVMDALPENAVVAGYWSDITPLQYLQFVEGQRPDIKIYDLFMFSPTDFHTFVENLSETGQTPIVLTNTAIMDVPDTSYKIQPILAYLPNDYQFIALPILAGFQISK